LAMVVDGVDMGALRSFWDHCGFHRDGPTPCRD
jgi:hypothetical protein